METKTHRGRFQFSLRTFLIAALLLGGGGGWLARRYWPTERAPDGKIIWVNHRDKKVWIRFDNRRLPKRGTAFKVYDGDRAITDWTEHKGVLLIGKKLGPGLVEASIERSEIPHPVAPDDSIYLRGWRAQGFK